MLSTAVSPVETVWSPSPASHTVMTGISPWISPSGRQRRWRGGRGPATTRTVCTVNCLPSSPACTWWTSSSPARLERVSTATGWSSPPTATSSGETHRTLCQFSQLEVIPAYVEFNTLYSESWWVVMWRWIVSQDDQFTYQVWPCQ